MDRRQCQKPDPQYERQLWDVCQLPGVPDAHLTVTKLALFVGGEARDKLALRIGESLVTGAWRRFDYGQAWGILEYLPPNTAKIPRTPVHLGGLMSL